MAKYSQNDLFKRVYSGEYSKFNLPEPLFLHTYQELIKEVGEGFGLPDAFPDNPQRLKLSNDFNFNINTFAGAKTFQNTNSLASLVFNESGAKRPFKEFVEMAQPVNGLYNQTWLKTEQDTAFGQAQSAESWVDMEDESEIFPFLQYQTADDERVRHEHAEWDNLIFPVDHEFWTTRMPLNGYNCRCRVIQLRDGETSSLKGVPLNEEKLFASNPGQTGVIFGETHPYYKVSKQDKPLTKNNFGLGFVEPPEVKTPAFVPAKTLKEAEDRIKSLGVKEVNLKNLKPPEFNAVLDVMESEAALSKLSLDRLQTIRRNNSAKALYSPSNKSISLNLANIRKAEFQEVVSYEQQIKSIQEVIEKFKKDYLGNPKYKQTTVQARLYSFDRRISDIKRKINAGEVARPWTVSTTYEDVIESLKATTYHELGHNRQYTKLSNDYFSYAPKNSISEYGRTNKGEYFAEMYSQWRMEGDEGIPTDILNVFKKLE